MNLILSDLEIRVIKLSKLKDLVHDISISFKLT